MDTMARSSGIPALPSLSINSSTVQQVASRSRRVRHRIASVLTVLMVVLLGGFVAPVATQQLLPSIAFADPSRDYQLSPTGEDDPLNPFIQMYRHRHTFTGSSS